MPARNTLTLGTDRALYVGEIPATGWHCHASPVLLMGLSGRFALHWGAGLVETCHSALVDAGVEHLFDPCGEVVALVYLEPDSPEARSLRSVFLQQGGVLLDVAAPVGARAAMEGHLRTFDLPALLHRPTCCRRRPRWTCAWPAVCTPCAARGTSRGAWRGRGWRPGCSCRPRASTICSAPKWA